ncbi:bifunctional glutamate N-acetyltransferase/amino-acid acetyltransferase ArgJ [Inquilinus sp. CAU 1745]|uniref:bifunctional glutamate N-acetyltransferase/amino-acid acetyltransferase ArgJ n=1 Tax=Inquilinus sp. CAU 1745 TaxID=3140369 RepID=UPI00325A848A
MALARSPLAPDRFPDLPPIDGVRVAGKAVGLKKNGTKDLFVALLDPGATIAGVLTRSRCASAPVEWCRQALKRGSARLIVANSGNSNAFTGNAGDRTVEETVAAATRFAGCAPHEVFIASTGVIGEPLGPDAIGARLPAVAEAAAPGDWLDAADAICTTDTFPKGATRTATIDGVTVTLCGIAKGSGMIAPDMATMLAFAFTDAAIAAPALQELLTAAADRSFNAITVDGDTSTSDTLLLAATGKAGHAPADRADDPRLEDFRRALDELMIDLAHQVVKDGEGAHKFVTIAVTGAESDRSARIVGLAIANSPLVKTAIAGEDANWGRIVMAVGKAGEKADRDRLSIGIGGVEITSLGQRVPDYDEAPVAAHMKGAEIDIAVDLGVGEGAATVWTCDLTHGYISINADYRS